MLSLSLLAVLMGIKSGVGLWFIIIINAFLMLWIPLWYVWGSKRIILAHSKWLCETSLFYHNLHIYIYIYVCASVKTYIFSMQVCVSKLFLLHFRWHWGQRRTSLLQCGQWQWAVAEGRWIPGRCSELCLCRKLERVHVLYLFTRKVAWVCSNYSLF